MITKNFKANENISTVVDIIGVSLAETPATMKYSIDGVTWTDWSEQISDSNVIITNIPKGLYIKFDKDGKYIG